MQWGSRRRAPRATAIPGGCRSVSRLAWSLLDVGQRGGASMPRGAFLGHGSSQHRELRRDAARNVVDRTVSDVLESRVDLRHGERTTWYRGLRRTGRFLEEKDERG